MHRFKARIQIIGVNPYVAVPVLISRSFRTRGFIPVKIKLNGHSFLANLVPTGGGRHRLYLHGDMRKKAGAQTGDKAAIELARDPKPRLEPAFKPLSVLLMTNSLARKNWKSLNASRQKEINRYLNRLKSKEAVNRNLARVMKYLLGRGDWFKSHLPAR